jgi:hypothetical protein
MCWSTRRQLDQHPPRRRYDKHISPPLSKRGGAVEPIRSLNFVDDGSRFTSAGIGAKFAIRAPREPPGVLRPVGLLEAVVRPETVEPLEDVATEAEADPELESDAVATVPWPEERRFG